MEINRRLKTVAKRFGPEFDVMNMRAELNQISDRLEELAAYGEHKIAQAKQRDKTGKSRGERAKEASDARAKEIADSHQAEVDAQLADQEQHRAQPESAEGQEVATDLPR